MAPNDFLSGLPGRKMIGSPHTAMLPLAPLALFALGFGPALGPSASPPQEATPEALPFTLEDRFGRSLQGRGIDLLDWEGVLANPRVELRVRPGTRIPPDRYPLRVVVRTSTPRLLLNRFSELNRESSVKILHLERPGQVGVFELAVFPDSDGQSEEHTLHVDLVDAAEHTWSLGETVRVEDRDGERAPGLPITLDFSHDPSGFFEDENARAIVARAATEIGDLLDEQGFASVGPGEELGWIWNEDSFEAGQEVTNPEPFSGFLLFVQGIHTEGLHSGSCASDRGANSFQMRGEQPIGLRRSGTIAIEVSGNWNGRGWYLDQGDPMGWMRSRNIEADQHDLLSIVRHELLHALAFHRAHRVYGEHVVEEHFVDPDLRAYLGHDPQVDESEHLCATVDPVSGLGAFGNEYGSVFPWRRWLPTKTDLLALKAVGYAVRPHSALHPLTLMAAEATADITPLEALAGDALGIDLKPEGGVPPYSLSLIEGALPEGVTLDSWSGLLGGTVASAGTHSFRVRLEDQDPSRSPLERSFELKVLAPSLPIEAQAPTEMEPEERPIFAMADFWKPDMETQALDPYLAPLLYAEAGEGRTLFPARLAVTEAGDVTFDPDRPTVYFAEGQLQVGPTSLRQMLFLWNLTENPVTGDRLQGLRITFASDGFPWIFETFPAPEKGAEVFVAGAAEEAALAAFGAPLEGKRLAIEADSAGSPGPRVRTIGDGGAPMGPYVYLGLDAKGIGGLHCRCEPTRIREQRSMFSYALLPIDEPMTKRLEQYEPDFRLGLLPPGLRLPPGD